MGNMKTNSYYIFANILCVTIIYIITTILKCILLTSHSLLGSTFFLSFKFKSEKQDLLIIYNCVRVFVYSEKILQLLLKTNTQKPNKSRWWLGVCVLNLQIEYEKSKSLGHVIKGSCDFMEGSSLLYVTTLKGLAAIDIMVMEIKCFYFVTWPHITTCSKGSVA